MLSIKLQRWMRKRRSNRNLIKKIPTKDKSIKRRLARKKNNTHTRTFKRPSKIWCMLRSTKKKKNLSAAKLLNRLKENTCLESKPVNLRKIKRTKRLRMNQKTWTESTLKLTTHLTCSNRGKKLLECRKTLITAICRSSRMRCCERWLLLTRLSWVLELIN